MNLRSERRSGIITVNLQRYDAAKADDWLDAVKRQVCPFCGEGPFVVVAQHTYQKHDVDALTLRDMIGLNVRDSICDPTYSAGRSAHTQDLRRAGKINSGTPERYRGQPRYQTNAGRQHRAQSGRERVGILHTPAIVAKIKNTKKIRNASRDADILERLRSTKDGSRAIAAALTIDRKTVLAVAAEHGIDLKQRQQ